MEKVSQADGRTDGQTDGRMDWTIHRAARSQLKNEHIKNFTKKFFESFIFKLHVQLSNVVIEFKIMYFFQYMSVTMRDKQAMDTFKKRCISSINSHS